MEKPRHRIAIDAALTPGALVAISDNQAHYLSHVLRLKPGDAVALFNRADGEWLAEISDVKKRALTLLVKKQLRAAAGAVDFWVAFAPIKGGRLETIIEKATELGASALYPVLTQRTIVDKVNVERADAIAREAAEQCERIDWPEIAPPQKLAQFLGSFPHDRTLLYGDETGMGQPIGAVLQKQRAASWCILVGPEGGFTSEELAMLRHVKNAHAVGLGPRILRADTAIITLAALTLASWGDWDQPPRFQGKSA